MPPSNVQPRSAGGPGGVTGPGSQGKQDSDILYKAQGGFVISAGNFHGEYPAKARPALAPLASHTGLFAHS